MILTIVADNNRLIVRTYFNFIEKGGVEKSRNNKFQKMHFVFSVGIEDKQLIYLIT